MLFQFQLNALALLQGAFVSGQTLWRWILFWNYIHFESGTYLNGISKTSAEPSVIAVTMLANAEEVR